MHLVLDPVPFPQSAIPTSVVLLPAMSIGTSQARVAVPAALCHAEERVDGLVRDENGVREEVVVVESEWQRTEDPRRHRRS